MGENPFTIHFRLQVFGAMGRALIFVLALSLCLSPSLAMDAPLPKKAARMLGAKDSLLVVAKDGKVLFSHNADKPRVPASTLKVFTALHALETLGASWTFSTEFYMDASGAFKVRGLGDPLLVSEVLDAMGGALAPLLPGCTRLVLDQGYFANPLTIPGASGTLNPYDAPVGALCANFNTVQFKRGPNNTLVTGEPQTPLIPFARQLIMEKNLPPGRVLLTQENNQAALYAGSLLSYFLQKHGMPCGEVVLGSVAPGDVLVYRHDSPYPLAEVARKFLCYSNNFIVNQVFLTLGAQKSGEPATLEKGVRAARQFAEKDLGIKDLAIVEGSGLARENQITPKQMITILDHFEKYHALLKQDEGAWYKTGTLDGVSTLAGYFPYGDSGELARFVIFFNSPGKNAWKLLCQVRSGL